MTIIRYVSRGYVKGVGKEENAYLKLYTPLYHISPWVSIDFIILWIYFLLL